MERLARAFRRRHSQERLRHASDRAIAYLAASQQADGSWIPLWFGNEHAPDENSPVYGTSRALLGLQTTLARDDARAAQCRRKGVEWLLAAQNADGGWGGDRGVAASIEETGVALAALGRSQRDGDERRILAATTNAARWLIAATSNQDLSAAPVGLYFARLWYYEALYPLVFGLEGLAGARGGHGGPAANGRARDDAGVGATTGIGSEPEVPAPPPVGYDRTHRSLVIEAAASLADRLLD